MSQIGIKVTADAESIQAYCHNVEGMLKTIYNDQLRKVKAINILKRIEKVVKTDYEKISEPELYYESGFNLLLPHNQLREYYRVNTEDFKALVDSFKLS